MPQGRNGASGSSHHPSSDHGSAQTSVPPNPTCWGRGDEAPLGPARVAVGDIPPGAGPHPVPGSQRRVSLFQQHIPPPTRPSAKPSPSKRPSSRSSSGKVRGAPRCGAGCSAAPGGPRLVADMWPCPLCVTQVPKAVTCLFITCPRSSGMQSSRRCSCLSAMSSLPKSLWTVPPTRVNALVSHCLGLSPVAGQHQWVTKPKAAWWLSPQG